METKRRRRVKKSGEQQREAKAKGMVAATRERRAAEDLDEQAKQAVERDDARDDRAAKVEPGTLIRVTYGAQKFSPVKYHTFDIGGGFIDVTVRPGESALDAWKRGRAILDQIVEEEFRGALVGFTKRVGLADAHVRDHAAKA